MSNSKIKRYAINGMQVLDAIHSLRVVVTPGDIHKGIRHDPDWCPLSIACRRIFDGYTTHVFKTVAIIELPDEQGNPVLYRHMLDKHAQNFIINFDRGKKVKPGQFILRKPIKSQRLDAQMEYQKNHRLKKNEKRAAKIIGETITSSAPKTRKKYFKDTTVRNETGMFNMAHAH